MATNSGVHSPMRAFEHPSPHSGSLRKRTDSSSMTTLLNRRQSSKPSMSAVVGRDLIVGSTKMESPPTGGICRKSPTSTMSTPPNGTPGSCLYRRSSLSSLSQSSLVIIETSSITSASRGAKFLSWIACSTQMRKLASVRAPISVAAFPVRAVFTSERSRCQLAQNSLSASMTRLFPVPPAPPRNMSS
ncbi:hypothetical protein PHMEG_0007040 [Phytophthora megakarya]|uniref:Uncharacterized protein n=1 Tax=Phytophthora megakarya TaxID=4795 RepID=A0A225WMU7_9STRA|nr:hypothetical protein PHMEG_0007040 [Phytophthora megakarya]